MSTYILNLPDISDYYEFLQVFSIGEEITILIKYKTLTRSDKVLIDIYLNEISEDTKIVAGALLTTDTLLCMPRTDINFNYYIHCIDENDSMIPLNKNNAHKYKLYFNSIRHNEE